MQIILISPISILLSIFISTNRLSFGSTYKLLINILNNEASDESHNQSHNETLIRTKLISLDPIERQTFFCTSKHPFIVSIDQPEIPRLGCLEIRSSLALQNSGRISRTELPMWRDKDVAWSTIEFVINGMSFWLLTYHATQSELTNFFRNQSKRFTSDRLLESITRWMF